MCVSVCFCVGRVLSFMWDPAADVTFLPVKATTRALHTIMYVTHQAYRKCAFPFTILLLFPIKSTKGNVIHSTAARLEFSLHVSVNQLAPHSHSDKEGDAVSEHNLILGHL